MRYRRPLVALLGLAAFFAFGQEASAPLTPGFSMRPSQVRVGRPVQFTDYSKGPIVSWLWAFGDGAISTERNPTHVFTTPGTYELSLTISDGTESVSLTRKLVR